MPTIKYYRWWCKTCNKFELHKFNSNDELICKCGTEYTEVYLNEIPNELLIEQRKRFVDSKSGFLNNILIKDASQNMFREVGSDVTIIECDAGQSSIEDELLNRWNNALKKIEENKKLQNEHKNLGRNDLCFCGSGLKYKKCCYHKIR